MLYCNKTQTAVNLQVYKWTVHHNCRAFDVGLYAIHGIGGCRWIVVRRAFAQKYQSFVSWGFIILIALANYMILFINLKYVINLKNYLIFGSKKKYLTCMSNIHPGQLFLGMNHGLSIAIHLTQLINVWRNDTLHLHKYICSIYRLYIYTFIHCQIKKTYFHKECRPYMSLLYGIIRWLHCC